MGDLEHAPEAAPVVVGRRVLAALGLDPDKIEAQALVLLCNRYQLDPLLGHVRIIQTQQGPRPYITRDGMLEVAHRSGQLDGIVVEEQRRNSEGNGWTAYVSVWRRDMSHPFTYGAQCKDHETQAKAGNGPEMALARAERRALKRAFSIPTAEGADAEDGSGLTVDRVEVAARARAIAQAGTGSPAVPTDATPVAGGPTLLSQNDAHRIASAWDGSTRAGFAERHGIARWGGPWPDAALEEVTRWAARPFDLETGEVLDPSMVEPEDLEDLDAAAAGEEVEGGAL